MLIESNDVHRREAADRLLHRALAALGWWRLLQVGLVGSSRRHRRTRLAPENNVKASVVMRSSAKAPPVAQRLRPRLPEDGEEGESALRSLVEGTHMGLGRSKQIPQVPVLRVNLDDKARRVQRREAMARAALMLRSGQARHALPVLAQDALLVALVGHPPCTSVGGEVARLIAADATLAAAEAIANPCAASPLDVQEHDEAAGRCFWLAPSAQPRVEGGTLMCHRSTAIAVTPPAGSPRDVKKIFIIKQKSL